MEKEFLARLRDALGRGEAASSIEVADEEQASLAECHLLTAKPVVVIANVDEEHLQENQYVEKLMEHANGLNEPCIQFCGKTQAEISQLDTESQKEFLLEMGLDELGLTKIIRFGYQILNLITFYTANENEAHAWTIPKGTSVQKAAGKIHTDFEKGFIKAEVIKFEDLTLIGSESQLREKGKIAVHGKDYIVEEGDLIYFRFNI